MPDFRVFCRPTDPASAQLTLSPGESHHLVVVNRARPGDPVVAFDGRGREWLCELSADRKQAAVLAVRSTRTAAPLPCAVTLGQAIPKGPAMDAIVRQATELGAAAVAPLATSRTQVHLDADRADRKTEKWQTAALEAAKQCGNPFLPEILPTQPLAAFLAATAGHDLKLVASLHPGARSLQTVLASLPAPPRTAAWLIGPEGDFSPAEIEAAVAAGYAPVTLGPLVLRADTAATYALSVLMHELRDVAG